jgi:hypothetical protein
MEIITTGPIFFQIMNYQGLKKQANLYEFSSLGRKFQLKLELSRHFEIEF